MRPEDGWVAVTGAGGFVGTHVTRVLLERGYRVRATVRDPMNATKNAHLDALARDGALELVRGDLLEAGSFDAAFAGCKAVVHTAAVALLSAKDAERTIVRPSIEGTRNVLASIERAGSVETIVHTSSSSATISHWVHDKVVSEADWADDATLESDPYGMAKREAERMVHAFGEQKRIRVAALNPALVLGRLYAKEHVRSSVSVVRDLVVGSFPACPRMAFGVVDAREVADAHAEALLRPEASGRYLLSGKSFWMQELAQELQRLEPGWKINTGKLPDFVVRLVALVDPRISGATLRQMLGRKVHYDGSRATRELGVTYRPMAETLHETARSLVEMGVAKPRLR